VGAIGRGHSEFTALLGTQFFLAHQPRHSLLTTVDPIFSQFYLNTGAAIGLTTLLMNFFDLLAVFFKLNQQQMVQKY